MNPTHLLYLFFIYQKNIQKTSENRFASGNQWIFPPTDGRNHRTRKYFLSIIGDIHKLFQAKKERLSEKPSHLQDIGASGELSTKIHESLITFLIVWSLFFDQNVLSPLDAYSKTIKLTALIEDINSSSDYVIFLSNKVTFLLNATLGIVHTEQNNIIKFYRSPVVLLLHHPISLLASTA